jgi:glycogen synthase
MSNDMPKRSATNPVFLPNAYLVETAWEVCNQVGGIYTVIRSKVPVMMEHWAGRYCLIGPYMPGIDAELEPLDDVEDVFGQAAAALRKRGFDVHYAEWLVTGKPRVVLLNPRHIEERTINIIKYLLWKDHGVSTPADNQLINQVVGFAYLTKLYIDELMKVAGDDDKQILAHFHEWMSGLPILDIKRQNMPVKTIFTTHATQLGRHLAINSPAFYEHLPFFDWEVEAKKFGVETEATMEYKISKACDFFTTVSDVTARECKYLLKREADAILPNGLNIHRFETLYEFQNLHSQYKDQIHEFVMGHFFHSYSFNLDKTMYFFTSGRFEFKNKGFDLTLEALSYLNEQLRRENSDVTVVMFFVSKREFSSIQPEGLHSRAVMEEIRQTCDAILKQVGSRLFQASTSRNDHRIPNLNDFVDEYWKLRYRRTIQSWKGSRKLPLLVTHVLTDEPNDEILRYLKEKNLTNAAEDKVKIVYHPDFISSTNPLFGMDYLHFVRGCNLGVFPSYYEPWGYTPLESLASGIPAVTSDLSGFGDYLLSNFPDHERNGIFVVERAKRTFDWSARQLAAYMHRFVKMARRERIIQRNNAENYSVAFDWKNLIVHYNRVYERASGT